MEKEIDQLGKWEDAIDSWYEAWKQKSFTMSTYAGLHQDEWNSAPHLTPKKKSVQDASGNSVISRESISRIRSIIGKSKSKEGGEKKEQE